MKAMIKPKKLLLYELKKRGFVDGDKIGNGKNPYFVRRWIEDYQLIEEELVWKGYVKKSLQTIDIHDESEFYNGIEYFITNSCDCCQPWMFIPCSIKG